MISKIKDFFDKQFKQTETDSRSVEEKMNLAAAVLLIEIAYSDSNFSDVEKTSLRKLLINQFAIEEAVIDELVTIAENEVREASSMYEFTRLINSYFEAEQKFLLIKAMWSIAYSDKKLDRFEESMIRKYADLLYVPHSEFIRAKIKTQEEMGVILRIT